MYRMYVNMRTRIGDSIVETEHTGRGIFDTYLTVMELEGMRSRVDWSDDRQGAWENHKQWVRHVMQKHPGLIAVAIPSISEE